MSDEEQIEALLKEFFKDEPEKVSIWLDTPNPMFGGITANYMISVGRAHKVLQFINAAKEGWYP